MINGISIVFSHSQEYFISPESQPEAQAIQAQKLKFLASIFDFRLTERQRFVLTRRYGLEAGEFRTLSEVGKEMNLSRERVRRIEFEALERLREGSKAY